MQNTASARLSRDIGPEEYDLVILGGGTGGTIAAWTFAGQAGSPQYTHVSFDDFRVVHASITGGKR